MNISDGDYLITTIVALFAVMGILALPPVFLAATTGLAPDARRKVAFQTTLAVALTLTVSFFVGTYILALFKIEMDAFKVAGAHSGTMRCTMWPMACSFDRCCCSHALLQAATQTELPDCHSG